MSSARDKRARSFLTKWQLQRGHQAECRFTSSLTLFLPIYSEAMHEGGKEGGEGRRSKTRKIGEGGKKQEKKTKEKKKKKKKDEQGEIRSYHNIIRKQNLAVNRTNNENQRPKKN